MRACILFVVLVSACDSHLASSARSKDCGIPFFGEAEKIHRVGGLVEIWPDLEYSFELQLPKGVAVRDGCWYLFPGPRVEGTFEPKVLTKGAVTMEYDFEIKNEAWTLVETKRWIRGGD